MNTNEQSKVYSSWCKHLPWRNMCMTDSTTIAWRYFVNHNTNKRQQAKQTLLKFFEILQFRAKFEISWCLTEDLLRFTVLNDHEKVTMNISNAMQLPKPQSRKTTVTDSQFKQFCGYCDL